MKEHTFKFNGKEIVLTPSEMYQVYDHYRTEMLKEYLGEQHPDWSEDKLESIAYETIRQELKYDLSEEAAIEEAIDWYENEYEKKELE